MTDLSEWAAKAKHVVAICGGAVSGAEAAAVCIEHGVSAIVFEQNRRPYGKIEDGLPRWHDKLRAQEYERIDQNLSADGVVFVPETVVGRDIAFEQMLREWGLSAVLLANGAWRDRRLPIDGADAFVGRGLVYQNPLVYWFNHAEEPDYAGPTYEVPDGTIVVGGGLASVDVAKIVNLTLYREALAKRGVEMSIVELEHRGIGPVLAEQGIAADELGIKGVTIYYRRRIADMPVAFPRGDDDKALKKVQMVREKLVSVLAEKFLIKVEPLHAPTGLIEEDGRLVGLRFQRTEMRDGRVVPVEGSEYDVRAPLVVSSIGSVPEPIAGIPMRGELFDFEDWDTGQVRGLPSVFGLGNVLTGKGNIKDSRKNAIDVAGRVLEAYLGTSDEEADEAVMADAHTRARAQAEVAAQSAIRRAKLSPEQLARIAAVIKARWDAVGYDGQYKRWVSGEGA